MVGEAISLPQLTQLNCSLNGNRQKSLSSVGVANLATRWHEVPLASPGGKLLSEARLMRGGDG